MKEMNRRAFLTLSGAAVVALSLAGCGGPSAPPTRQIVNQVQHFQKRLQQGFSNQDIS